MLMVSSTHSRKGVWDSQARWTRSPALLSIILQMHIHVRRNAGEQSTASTYRTNDTSS